MIKVLSIGQLPQEDGGSSVFKSPDMIKAIQELKYVE